jgi:polyhydroxyalkanoate synthesis regulator phasin
VNDALNRYIEAAAGFTQVTKDTAEKIVRNLVRQGETATRNPQEMVEQLVERSQENREAMTALVRSETKRMVKRMGLATQTDVDRLQRQVADLRRKLAKAQESADAAGQESAGGGGTSASGARANPAKKAAKRTARKRTQAAAGDEAGS